MGSRYLGVIYAEVVFRETRIMARMMDWKMRSTSRPMNRVYLTGVVPTVEEKQRARELAFKVVGVLTVVNDLEVQEGHSL